MSQSQMSSTSPPHIAVDGEGASEKTGRDETVDFLSGTMPGTHHSTGAAEEEALHLEALATVRDQDDLEKAIGLQVRSASKKYDQALTRICRQIKCSWSRLTSATRNGLTKHSRRKSRHDGQLAVEILTQFQETVLAGSAVATSASTTTGVCFTTKNTGRDCPPPASDRRTREGRLSDQAENG